MSVPGGASGKEPACQRRRHRDSGFTPGLGGSRGRGNSNPLQFSSLENPIREAWRATAHSIAKSWARLKRLTTCLSCSQCVSYCVPADTSGPMGGGPSSSRGGKAATRGSWQAGMTLNNPPGAVTRDKLSWIKGARVFIVFLPHTDQNGPGYLQVLAHHGPPGSVIRAARQGTSGGLG